MINGPTVQNEEMFKPVAQESEPMLRATHSLWLALCLNILTPSHTKILFIIIVIIVAAVIFTISTVLNYIYFNLFLFILFLCTIYSWCLHHT